MKIEIDVSELDWGTYYKDEKCRELEKLLRSDSRYAECDVKRAHWDEETTDPFHVLDESGEQVVMLERWEVYALNGSEIFSYIEVQEKRRESLGLVDVVLFGLFIALGSMAAGFHIYSFLDPASSISTSLILLLDLLSLCLGVLCILRYRNTVKRRKNVDLEAVRSDSSFLDVLRRLAEIPESENPLRNEYVKRVQYVENTLAGTDS